MPFARFADGCVAQRGGASAAPSTRRRTPRMRPYIAVVEKIQKHRDHLGMIPMAAE